MTNTEREQTLKEIRHRAGVTNKSIWIDRIKSLGNNALLFTTIWCIYNGIIHIGFKGLYVALLSFTLIETIVFATKHTYYGFKLKRKYPNKF